TEETLWKILHGELTDTQVNELLWFYLGYRQTDDEQWDLSAVPMPFSEKFPTPPDFIGSRPATVQLTRSIPKPDKQLLKDYLGFKGYSIDQLIPRLTRRATAVSWLLSHMNAKGLLAKKADS
ncbi:MAG: DUF1823 family protein, partial [Acaryochloridaceae cyanobacterium RL_2_7]|nr:DUF1823 family protein [Acaryochloridaceae cyanobacterium RL_2_7]